MEAIKQQLSGIIALMDDTEIQKLWNIMKIVMPGEILAEMAFDLSAIAEIENNPDCKEYVSGADAYMMLGWE